MKRKNWEGTKQDELQFWDDWFRTKSENYPGDYERRFRADTKMDDYIIEIAKKIGNGKILKLLDTGAGPATCLGKVDESFNIQLKAVDALGSEYQSLYNKYNAFPPVQTEECDTEKLLEKFEPGTFDIVHNRNALDHGYDPVEGIRQMLSLVRTGGAVVLLHEENEGENEGYWGMHQWNFKKENGDFLISNRFKKSFNVNVIFSPFATVNSEIIQMGPARLLKVVLIKTANSGEVKLDWLTRLKLKLQS